MLEKELNNENKIPGCTRMTRPEEISALSKYLGNVRRVQEEHSKIGESALELNGQSRIPEINSLEDRLYALDKTGNNSPSRLVHEEELLPENRNKKKIELGKDAERLEPGRNKIEKLGEGKDKVPESTHPNSLYSLPENIERIENLRNKLNSLPNSSSPLPESSSAIDLSSLFKGVEELEGKKKELETLSTSSENLPSATNLSPNPLELEKEAEKLKPGKEKIENLGNEKLDLPLKPEEIGSLPSNMKGILPGESPEIPYLPQTKDELEGVKEIDRLEEGVERLKDNRRTLQELPRDKEELPGRVGSIELEGEKEKIPGEQKPSPILSQATSETLPETKGEKFDNSLERGKDNIPLIHGVEEVGLSEKIEDILGDIPDVQLEIGSKDIPDSTTNSEIQSLVGTSKSIEGDIPEIPTLPGDSYTLPSSTSPKSEIEDLGEEVVKISGERIEPEELSTEIEVIVPEVDKEKIKSLPENYEQLSPIPENEIEDLSLYSDKLNPTPSDPYALSDHVERLEPKSENGVEGLSEHVETLEPEPTEPTELSEHVETLEPPTTDIEELQEELSDIQKLEPPAEDVEGLSEYQEILQPSPEEIDELPKELQEDQKVQGDLREPEKLSDYQETLEPQPEEIESIPEELESEDQKIQGDLKEPENLSEYQEILQPSPEEIDELPKELQEDQKVQGDLREPENLSEYVDELNPKPEEIESIPEELESEDQKIQGDLKEPEELSDYKDELNPKPEEIESIPEELESEDQKIQGDLREPENLSEYKETIDNIEEIDSLSDFREDIENYEDKVESLSEYQETLEPQPEEIESIPSELESEDQKVQGDLKEPENLSDHKETIDNVEEIDSLSDFREDIENYEDKVENLSDHKESLGEVEELESLSDYIDLLEADDDNSLSTHKEVRPEDTDKGERWRTLREAENDPDGSLRKLALPTDEGFVLRPQNIDPEDRPGTPYEELAQTGEDGRDPDYVLKTVITGPINEEGYVPAPKPINPEIEGLYDAALSRPENQGEESEDIEELYDSALGRPDHELRITRAGCRKDATNKKYNYLESLSEDPKSGDPQKWLEETETDIVYRPQNVDPAYRPGTPYEELAQTGEDGRDPDYVLKTVITGPINEEGYVPTPDSVSPEIEDLYNLPITRPDNESREGKWEKLIEIDNDPEEFGKLSKPIDEELLKILRERNPDKKYNILLELLSEGGENSLAINKDLADKWKSVITSIYNDCNLNPEKVGYYEGKTQEIGTMLGIEDYSKELIPAYALPKLDLATDASSWIRSLAEIMVPRGVIKGGARELLLNESIAIIVVARELLQKLTKTEPWRLPGTGLGGMLGVVADNVMSGGLQGALHDSAGVIAGAIGGGDKPNPYNPPRKKTKGWDDNLSSRHTTSENGTGTSGGGSWIKNALNSVWTSLKDFAGGWGDNQNYTFAGNYMQGAGIGLTLNDLCVNTKAGDISTVEQLKRVLQQSPYISTPNKFTTTKSAGYVTSTLDSNAYWEIILEPYLGKENGGVSFLPSFREINVKNFLLHGIRTNYNHWVPVVGFDLQKSKMTSKSIGLYDGEISIPVNMEFTNEFRLTFVDDQYKSWKTFWETVAEVSIYSSLPHDAGYYEKEDEDNYTVLDTKTVCPANYKNLTWRCRIYVMTPQMSTIRKFDLLLVMKDMIEEYTGEIDAGGVGDLTINFSIVGENPTGNEIAPAKVEINKDKDVLDDKNFRNSWDISSSIGSALQGGMTLLGGL